MKTSGQEKGKSTNQYQRKRKSCLYLWANDSSLDLFRKGYEEGEQRNISET